MFPRLKVEAQFSGLSEMRHMGDPALSKAAEVALSKITASLPERVQRQAVNPVSRSLKFLPRPAIPAHFSLLRQVSRGESGVQMRYRDLNRAQTNQRIRPLAMVCFDNALMCMGWCLLRQDLRRFHLDQKQNVIQTGNSFRPAPAAHVAPLRCADPTRKPPPPCDAAPQLRPAFSSVQKYPRGVRGAVSPPARRTGCHRAAKPASSAVRITCTSPEVRINGGDRMMLGPDTRTMAPA